MRRVSGESGFTLLELLLAMTLSGLLLASLVAGLRLISSSWTRGAELAEAHEALGISQGFLRREMSRVQWLYFDKGTREELAFEGSADRLLYVVAGGEGAAPAGLFAIELEIRPRSGGGERLFRSQAPFHPEVEDFADLDFEDEVLLLESDQALRFSFKGPGRNDSWSNSWRGEESLPALLRLGGRDLELLEEGFPLLIAPLGAQIPSGCLSEEPPELCIELALAERGQEEAGQGTRLRRSTEPELSGSEGRGSGAVAGSTAGNRTTAGGGAGSTVRPGASTGSSGVIGGSGRSAGAGGGSEPSDWRRERFRWDPEELRNQGRRR